MIDGTALIIAGVVAQAAIPARRVCAAIRPRLRGPGVLVSIALAPLPHADAAPGRPLAAIVVPAPPDR